MKIQNKILLFLGVIIFAFVGIIIVIWISESEKINSYQNERTSDRQKMLDVTIELIGSNLSQFAYDYSYWDEMFTFVDTKDKQWASYNIESTIATFNVNLIWIFNKNLEQIFSFNLLKNSELLLFPVEKSKLSNLFKNNKFQHFFLKTSAGIIEIRTAPIQPSEDINRLSGPNGYLIAGRIWDDMMVEKISILTSSEIKLVTDLTNDEINAALSEGDIVSEKILYDYDNKFAGKIYSVSKFPVYNVITSYFKTQLFIIILFSATVILIFIFFSLFLINNPIKKITGSLESSNPLLLNSLKGKNNEFGVISRLIIKFFEQKELILSESKKREKLYAELVESERRISEIYNNIQMIALVLNNKGEIEMCNDYLCNLLGYSNDEIIGKNWFDNFLPDIDGKISSNKYIQSIMEGNIPVHFENPILTKTGEERLVSWNNIVLKDTKGNSIGSASIGVDITEQRKNEKILLKAKEEAEKANKTKSVFLANMSHELRTPLVGILGFAEILSNVTEDKNIKEKAEMIYVSGQRLLDTLNSILDLSAIEADKLDVFFCEINIVKLLSEVKEIYEVMAGKKGLYIKLFITVDNLVAYTDERLLRQVLNNLVNNAIKYTKKGGVTITLFKDSNKKIGIKISDTGIGMTEDFQKIMFNPFTQASEGYARKFEGSGLGLHIANRFLIAINGEISVNSEIGRGSDFTVRIPCLSDNKTNFTAKSDSPEIYSEPEHFGFNYINLLLVDDDETNQELVSSILKNSKINLDIVSSAEESLVKCKNKNYNAILMDISLGKGKSGIDILREIKEVPGYEKIPVAAFTAHSMKGQREEFIEKGFTHYLSKPYKNRELSELIKKMLL